MFKNVQILDNFSVKILIDINIIESKRMIINVNTLIIECCRNFKVNFSITSKKFFINRIVICVLTIVISAHINIKILKTLRKKSSLSDRDYMFHFDYIARLKSEREIFSHIIDLEFSKVTVINSFVDFVIISKRTSLNVVKKFEKNECYIISKHDAHFAAKN